ncbi:MAG: SDR family NAD(P)-dependent oxidoreductase [Candidatus Hydrogenedentes bacterium]|nr:SDR family NAD(P)-dependent oxidoreductase [Candidatus Hydrogenedentota bacterium]
MSTTSNRTYFMTGCASGIGRHVADLLIARGERVYATDVNLDAMTEYAEKSGWPKDRVYLDKLDVRSIDAWGEVFGRAVETCGAIDVCMNIAGIMLSGWCYEQPVKEIDLQIDINLKGVIWGTQTAAQHMIPRKSGHIVNIASMAGIASIPGLSVYTATKHGVRGFSLAASYDLKPHGIAVTAVCPDAINTPLLEQSSKTEAGAMVFSGSRLLTLEEIGDLIVNRVLVSRPIEVAVPFGRAVLAKTANLFPAIGGSVLPSLTKKGRVHQGQHAAKLQS